MAAMEYRVLFCYSYCGDAAFTRDVMPVPTPPKIPGRTECHAVFPLPPAISGRQTAGRHIATYNEGIYPVYLKSQARSSRNGPWNYRETVQAVVRDPESGTGRIYSRAPQDACSGPIPRRTGSPGRRADWACPSLVIDGQHAAGPPQCLPGLKDLADSGRYAVWLLDQFGVLHDGQKAYPGAVDALQNLARSGAKLVLISNSSKRSQVTIDKLPGLGFDPALFSAVVTSGELTHQNLASFLFSREDPWFKSLGRKCIHFTWSTRGAISLEGLNLKVVERPQEADFLLAHGTEAIGTAEGPPRVASIEEMKDVLRQCSQLATPPPLIVANPDMVTVEARALRSMPGTLGLFYEELGGFVRWMGKPDLVIYAAAMGTNRPGVCVGVGDSLHHDIVGANKAGIDSVFVTGGIHADELLVKDIGQAADSKALKALLEKGGGQPSYVIPSFKW